MMITSFRVYHWYATIVFTLVVYMQFQSESTVLLIKSTVYYVLKLTTRFILSERIKVFISTTADSTIVIVNARCRWLLAHVHLNLLMHLLQDMAFILNLHRALLLLVLILLVWMYILLIAPRLVIVLFPQIFACNVMMLTVLVEINSIVSMIV